MWQWAGFSMSDIILYGGAFDPVGRHHIRIANQAQQELGWPVWFMPCYAHRFEKDTASTEHRLNMIRIAITECPEAMIFDWEIINQHCGSTYKAINQIKLEYPQYHFHLMIGMDNANIITQEWFCGPQLIEQNPFVIVARPGHESKTCWYMSGWHRIITLDDPGSSSNIRSLIAASKYTEAEKLVAPGVWEYIKANQLYGYSHA